MIMARLCTLCLSVALIGRVAAGEEPTGMAPDPPRGPREFPGVALKQVVLYVRPQEIGARLGEDVGPFADYMKKVAEAAGESLSAVPKGQGQTMMVIVGIKPENKARIWYTVESDGVKREVLNEITKKVEKLRVPAVKRVVAAAWQVDLWGGPAKSTDGPPPEALQFPKEWLDAARKKGVKLRIPLDDDDLKLIWP